jgi:SAM-dependent methyltransferase
VNDEHDVDFVHPSSRVDVIEGKKGITTMTTMSHEEIRATVREHYGKIANTDVGCCGPAAGCCGPNPEASRALGYSADEIAAVPEGANLGLGCGNPQAIASLRPGDTVLDLGSGAGFDAFLAAKGVGPTGRVIGVDMTPAMIDRARANAQRAGANNVEFRLGEIEHLPVDEASVDVVLSNCVLNLVPDKAQAFREAFRVLKPGGRLAVSDVVLLKEAPESLRAQAEALSGCITGAALVPDIERWLRDAGFGDVRVVPKPESRAFIADWLPGSGAEEYVSSATIEATRPVTRGACCAPGCCA